MTQYVFGESRWHTVRRAPLSAEEQAAWNSKYPNAGYYTRRVGQRNSRYITSCGHTARGQFVFSLEQVGARPVPFCTSCLSQGFAVKTSDIGNPEVRAEAERVLDSKRRVYVVKDAS